jgi:Mg/Co/Ni transporter MgtE
MAFLNKQERDDLAEELRHMPFRRIKGKLQRMDKKGRLAYYRNAQLPGKLVTRYILEGMGIVVTLLETVESGENNRAEYTLQEIIIDPTDENRL